MLLFLATTTIAFPEAPSNKQNLHQSYHFSTSLANLWPSQFITNLNRTLCLIYKSLVPRRHPIYSNQPCRYILFSHLRDSKNITQLRVQQIESPLSNAHLRLEGNPQHVPSHASATTFTSPSPSPSHKQTAPFPASSPSNINLNKL